MWNYKTLIINTAKSTTELVYIYIYIYIFIYFILFYFIFFWGGCTQDNHCPSRSSNSIRYSVAHLCHSYASADQCDFIVTLRFIMVMQQIYRHLPCSPSIVHLIKILGYLVLSCILEYYENSILVSRIFIIKIMAKCSTDQIGYTIVTMTTAGVG